MLPLLETKLYVPQPRRGVVPRARLGERLNRGAGVKLTLVSAPAGFGKTTLLADWLAAVAIDGRTVAWLSLDQSDNHPGSFWTYLVAALQTVAPGVGENAISLLQSPQPPLAAEHGATVLRGTADMHVGMSQVHRERNNLDAATRHLLKSQELGEHTGLPQNRYRWRVGMARIREAQGDLDGAVALLDEAARVYTTDFLPSVRPMPARKARVWLAQGRTGLIKAVSWVREQGLSPQDELSYVREFEHITLARVLLANRAGVEAMDLLGRLLKAAEDGGRSGSVIEILVLQALAQQSQANIPAALVSLERALKLAEPEGYVRMFVDEGPPLAALLEVALKRQIAPDYVHQLLDAFGNAQHTAPVKQLLIEPLSERELDVLRLLGTDLDGPEIARHLVVSLSTVRTHTQNIFNKLGVNNRRAAVRRAEELDLLSRNRNR